jgi:anaerobic magnesium-protoporphyrin IX monomethyl ester cyclase
MITLINPPGFKTFSGLQMHLPNPPLGLAYIAAAIKEAGFPYHVIDGAGEALDHISAYPGRKDFMIQGLTFEEIVTRIPPETDVIGIGCTFSTLWPLTRRLAAFIRLKFPHAFMVLGGEHGTAVPEHSLQTSPFNVVVLGEGEETFINLLKARAEGRPLRDVKGIAFREGDEIVNTGLSARTRAVDSIPLPDWDSLPIEEYIARHQINGINLGRSMPMLATRGCPYQCTFCSSPNMWTTRWFPRNPKLVADEIELYAKKYNVTNFDFQDLTAIIKRQWIVDFTHELMNRGLKITWQMPSGTRSEVFDEEVADLLYRSGCRSLAFAPESGSPEILKSIKKHVNLEKMQTSMRIAVKRGLSLSCFFVIGFPDDTPETIKQTLKLVRKIALIGVQDVSVTKFVPYPGSELFKRLLSERKVELNDEFFIIPMDYSTKKAPSYSEAVPTPVLVRKMLWIFVNFYVISFVTRPFRVIRALSKAVFQGVEESRYAKWFVDRLFVRRKWRKMVREGDFFSPLQAAYASQDGALQTASGIGRRPLPVLSTGEAWPNGGDGQGLNPQPLTAPVEERRAKSATSNPTG